MAQVVSKVCLSPLFSQQNDEDLLPFFHRHETLFALQVHEKRCAGVFILKKYLFFLFWSTFYYSTRDFRLDSVVKQHFLLLLPSYSWEYSFLSSSIRPRCVAVDFCFCAMPCESNVYATQLYINFHLFRIYTYNFR